MTPRIVPTVRRCAMRGCKQDGNHDVVDEYGKKIGAYCLPHAQAVLDSVLAYSRTRRVLSTGGERSYG